MKLARGWSCLVLLVALLNLSGCDWIKKICCGGAGGGVTPRTFAGGTTKIEITGCKINPPVDKEIIRPTGDAIKWYTKDTNTYTITFAHKYDPPGSTNDITPFPPGHQLTVKPTQEAVWNLSTLDGTTATPTDCPGDTITLPNSGFKVPSCYYEYTISSSGCKVPPDPGVHVTPDGP